MPAALHTEPQHHRIGQHTDLGPEPGLPPNQIGKVKVAVPPPGAQAHRLHPLAISYRKCMEFQFHAYMVLSYKRIE